MELIVTPIYKFNKVMIGKKRKKIAEEMKKEFMARRNAAVEVLTQEKYAMWNEEFDRKYPGKDGTSKEYADYIANKTDVEITRNGVNQMNIGTNSLYLMADRSIANCGDIMAVSREDESIKMTAHFKVLKTL